MFLKQPGKFHEASNWFGELAKFAGSVKRSYSKADRQTVIAAKQMKKAIRLALRADKDAFELVGNCAPVLDPSNKDSELKSWISWTAEIFREVYAEEFEHSKEPGDGDEEE